jgi:hypothetical protein
MLLRSALGVLLGLPLISCGAVGAEVTVEKSDRGAVVQVDGKPFAEYLTRSGHQPAVWPIIGPTGKAMTRSYGAGPQEPGETNDHPHHHSLWFTHGDMNGADFWRGPDDPNQHGENQIVHREFVALENMGDQAKIVTRNDWIGGGKKVCEDERTLVFGADDKARWIDFGIVIRASEGDLTLGDTKEGTLGVRVADSMRVEAKKGGRIVNSEGLVDDDAWGMAANWVDNSGPVGDETLGIAIFSHPDNFRPACRWHARSYGLLAANPFGQREFMSEGPQQEAVHLGAGEELSLRYRIFLHKGHAEQGGVAEAYEAYGAE